MLFDGCFLCVFFLLPSLHISRFVSVAFEFNASPKYVAPRYPIPFSVEEKRKEKEYIVDGCLLCVSSFLLSLPHRWSSVSAPEFSESLNDVIPASPRPLSIYVKRNEKSELLMDVFCVSSFFLSSPLRSSFVSVVFDFNPSLNAVAPVSPIPLPVDVDRKEKSELLMNVFCVSSFFLSSQLR